jgi:diphthamide biosynthesis protein 2
MPFFPQLLTSGPPPAYRTAAWIVEHGFQRVALQFPDHFVHRGPATAVSLSRLLTQSPLSHPTDLFVLADTTQNPLCVDEVAAAHANADALVHYGPSDLSPVTRLPTLLVLGVEFVDVKALASVVLDAVADVRTDPVPEASTSGRTSEAVVFLEQGRLHARADLVSALLDHGNVAIHVAQAARTELWPRQIKGACGGVGGRGGWDRLSKETTDPVQPDGQSTVTVAGFSWPAGVAPGATLIWVGSEDASAFSQLQLTFYQSPWRVVDTLVHPPRHRLADVARLQRTINGRYFLIDMARNVTMVGILVGTLGVAGFRHVIARVRHLAQSAGKKTYTVLVGKPNPSKLANFPEIELWVMVSSPQGIILDTKEYFCKIITPYEAEIAWGDREEWTGSYRLDHEPLLRDYREEADTIGRPKDPRQIGMTTFDQEHDSDTEEGGVEAEGSAEARVRALTHAATTTLAQRADAALSLKGKSGAIVTNAAEYYMAKRTYWGVETPALGAEEKPVVPAVEGRDGRAAGYVRGALAEGAAGRTDVN